MPFPYDAVSSVAVELAPMSVVYGGFSACNINAVTKSGENELFGSIFFDYGSDDLRGDSLEGEDLITQEYEETRWGFEIGGAIIQDKLFFYGAYEKYDGADLFDRGAQGSGAVNEVLVSQAELDRIAQIAQDVYQFNPGSSIPEAIDFEDEKYLAKIDWYITDRQRLALTYLYNDSFNATESDGELDEFEFDLHYYNRGAELNSYTINLFSDWTDNFSTEIRYSLSDVDFLQEPRAGKEFGEIRVELEDVDVYLGGDDSRHANELDYEIEQIQLRATYLLGNHVITGGLEREQTDVFNLFYQHVDTEIRFDGIDNFEAGIADRVEYGNAVTNNEIDAGVSFDYAVNTAYLQDEWQVNDQLNLTFGLRYDYYEADDGPVENTDFTEFYGFPNTATFDGLDLVQPRVGFTFEVNDDITLRGGAGLFSGGNPNVWYSNVYSNTNVLAVQTRLDDVNLFDLNYVACEEGVPNGPGYCVPEELFNQVASGEGTNFEIVYLDPDFELPSEWKYSLGATWITPNDYVVTADAQISRGNDTAIYKRGDLEFTGEFNDFGNGYPVYEQAPSNVRSFVLTNSSVGNEAESVAFSIFKAYEFGLDARIGYAWTDSRDVNPMTSSVAFSNYINRSFYDPQEEVLSTSNWNIEHRFTLVLNYGVDFWEGYTTRFTLFGQANSGVPYSITLPGSDGTSGAYGFTPFLDFEENVLVEPGTRNEEEGSWFAKMDLRISQQLPGFGSDHRASAFLIVDNFSNLLNDEWGIQRQVAFPNGVTQDQIDQGQAEGRIGDSSLWEIRVGVDYRF